MNQSILEKLTFHEIYHCFKARAFFHTEANRLRPPQVVYSKAVVPVLVLLFVAL